MSRKRSRRGTEPEPPEALTPYDEAVDALARRRVSARVNGEQRELEALEFLLFKTFETGIGGSPYAQRVMLDRFHRVAAQKRDLLAAEVRDGYELLARQRRWLVDARAAGRPERDVLPHPDDIVIDPATGVRIAGPRTPEERAICEETRALRDALLLQAALEERDAPDNALDAPRDPAHQMAVLALLLDQRLPERLRLADHELMKRMRLSAALPRRALLRALRRAWRERGCPLPRGWRLPGDLDLVGALELRLEMLARWRRAGGTRAALDGVVDAIAAEQRRARRA